jgi:hypothetical protein
MTKLRLVRSGSSPFPSPSPSPSSDFQIVILDSPYDCLGRSDAQKFFGSFMDLKLRGYGCEYPYGVMPVDTTDFIATHLGVFMHRGGDWVPIAAYKSISEKKCRLHGVQFSGVQVPLSSGASQAVRAVESLIEKSKQTGSFLTYEGGWTIDPSIRKDPALVTEVHHLCTTMHISQHLLYGKIDSICCGLLRFRTDRIMKGWGYHVLSYEGQEIQPFAQASLKGEMVHMHHTTQFSEEALKTAENYAHYWNNRIQIGKAILESDLEVATEVSQKKKAA